MGLGGADWNIFVKSPAASAGFAAAGGEDGGDGENGTGSPTGLGGGAWNIFVNSPGSAFPAGGAGGIGVWSTCFGRAV